jgi:hypothetical protein
MKKVYVVIEVLRQMGGDGASALMDYVGVKMHRAFTDQEKASEYAMKYAKRLNKEEKINSPEGQITCLVCEAGVHPVELEE